MTTEMLDRYREYVKNGNWSKSRVDMLLKADKLTIEEYNYILGFSDAVDDK